MANEIYDELIEGEWANGTPEQQQLQKSFDNQVAASKRPSMSGSAYKAHFPKF
jgi:hypothetical protein